MASKDLKRQALEELRRTQAKIEAARPDLLNMVRSNVLATDAMPTDYRPKNMQTVAKFLQMVPHRSDFLRGRIREALEQQEI